MRVVVDTGRPHVLVYFQYAYALACMTLAYAVLGFLESFELQREVTGWLTFYLNSTDIRLARVYSIQFTDRLWSGSHCLHGSSLTCQVLEAIDPTFRYVRDRLT